MPSLLVLPDGHANYRYDNLRFRALGNFIVEYKPDIVVNLGDFADMESLSSYDIGTATFEGRRYKNDIEVAIDAQEELFSPIISDNRKRHKAYKPRLVLTLGNHDGARIVRAANSDPKLQGIISVDNLQYTEYGWEVYPFLVPVTIQGISFSHYFVSGVASRPISGENIGKTLCTKLHASAVQGHSHIYDMSERTVITGNRIFGMSAGCYVHPDYSEEWCIASQPLWWRGVVLFDELDGKGYYNQLTIITMRKLLRDYL